MSLLLAWILFPAVALIASVGHGLLVERAAGARLPGTLLLPVGMAALVCVTQLPTFWDATAEATLPLVVLVTAAGLWLGRTGPRDADRWAATAAAGVFAVFAAPVVLSGEASFSGYTVLGDTSIHFIGADALLTNGRDFAGLPPSSYEFSLTAYYGANGYPSGGPTTVGALTTLAGQDVAWTFQPFLSLLAALMALALYELARPLVQSPRLRAAVAFVAAQPALVLAYALQGSVKEVGTVFAITLAFALVPAFARQAGESVRRVLPLVVAASAAVGIVGLAAGVWIGPLILVLAAVAARAGIRFLLATAALALAVAAVLNYQALADLATYVEVSGGVVTAQQEFGNLLGPLDPRSRFGIWLTGDYRVPPVALLTETRIFQWVVWLAMAGGAYWTLRRRAWGMALFLVVSVIAHVYVMRNGSPWADGKALMIVSPALLVLACVAAGALHAWRRPLAWGLVGFLGFGVLWSNALAYHDVSNAPRDRMQELAHIGERIDGEGPTLYPEFEEFAKHFLRHGAPEGPTEGWQRRYALSATREGEFVRQGFSVDLDRLRDEYMAEYETVVLRRGYASSRPGSDFRRTWSGRFYEIWQRPEGEPRLIEHLSLGGFRGPVTRPDCEQVRRLAGVARARGGRLAFVERPEVLLDSPAMARLPTGWYVDPTDASAVVARGQGDLIMRLPTATAGRHSLWLEGSFGRAVTVFVDGRRAGRVGGRLNGRGSAEHIADLDLAPGLHEIRVSRAGGSLAPGTGGGRLIGPVTLTEVDPGAAPVQTVDAAQWRSLCGRTMDWIEAVRG